MPHAYSDDLRARVIARIESGFSRHEAADGFDIGVSSAIRWAQRYAETGSFSAKPTGGSVSPLEARAGDLLALISEHAGLTLDEMTKIANQRGIKCARTSFWRFLTRHGITLKKNSARVRTRTA